MHAGDGALRDGAVLRMALAGIYSSGTADAWHEKPQWAVRPARKAASPARFVSGATYRKHPPGATSVSMTLSRCGTASSA